MALFRRERQPRPTWRGLSLSTQRIDLRNPNMLRAITAAAASVDMTDRTEGRRERALRQGWQSDAWTYRDAIGELRYATEFLANCVARMRFFPAAYPLDGDAEEPVPLDEIPEAPPELKQACLEAMADLGVGLAIRQIAMDWSRNTSVAGECWLLGRTDQQTGLYDWSIRSVDEIVIRDDRYQLREIPSDPNGAVPWVELNVEEDVLSRIWTPHPRFKLLADSPLKAILDDCEALMILRRMIRAAGRSRLAGAGLLGIPEELTIVRDTDDDEDPEADPFTKDLTAAMTTPISDEGVASAVVPIVVRGPADALKGIVHIKLSDQFAAQDIQVRAELLSIIATSIDLPKEVLTGIADLNHWSAWQVDDNTFRHHVEPHVILGCDGFTSAYLRPRLAADRIPEEWIRRTLLWYDPTELVTHPDRAAEAKDAYGNMAISGEAYRRYTGFTEADAPETDELEARRLWDIRALPLNLLMEYARRADPTLVVPPITQSGTVPGIKLGGVDAGVPSPPSGGDGSVPTGGSGAPAPSPPPPGPPPADRPLPTPITAAGAEPNTGVMVALYPPPPLAETFALDGGEPPEELHITLAFLGNQADLADPEALKQTVQQWATSTGVLSGEISGVGLFTAGEDPVTYLSIDLPALPGARQQLVSALAGADLAPSQLHGFTPHLTLDYADRIGDVDKTVAGTTITFDQVALVIGEERADYPLSDALTASGRQRTSERLSHKLAEIDRDLRARVQTAANAAMLRALERAGARLRTKVAKDETLRTKIAHRANERVPAILGPDVVTAAGLSHVDLLGEDWSQLRGQFHAWTEAAQKQALSVAMRLGQIDETSPAVASAQQAMDTGRDRAWEHLSGTMTSLGQHLLYNPDPNTQAGDWGQLDPSTLVPTGTVRAALALAGGSAPTALSTSAQGGTALLEPVGQIGTGSTIGDLITSGGGEQQGYEWHHASTVIKPFGPHEALDGVQFANFDDDVLANSEGFPDNEYFMPGDHDGCTCDFVPMWVSAG